MTVLTAEEAKSLIDLANEARRGLMRLIPIIRVGPRCARKAGAFSPASTWKTLPTRPRCAPSEWPSTRLFPKASASLM